MATSQVEPVVLELDRLEQLAESGYYNPYTLFDWPEAIEPDLPWMSESLTTLAGTEMWDELTREQQIALTKYETINFFSLNVHGIRELMSEVVLRIHDRTYAGVSEFLHHFIGEENEHMWFFAQFCLRYGGKMYPAQPTLIRMQRTPCQAGLSEYDQNRAGRAELLATPFAVFERNIREQLARILGPGGFDPARDIEGIMVNRWPHGYAPEYNPLFDPDVPPEQRAHVIARAPFGNITIANSDAGGEAYTDCAIDQAHRAVMELPA